MIHSKCKKDTSFRGIHLEDAGRYGLTEAFIIQQILHWCKLVKRSPAEGIYKSSAEWEHDLLYIAKRTSIRLAIKNLKDRGIITITQGAGRQNQEVWYGLNVELLKSDRANFNLPKLKSKAEQNMKPCTFNASLKGTNLERMCNYVVQNLNFIEGDESLEELHLVVQNTAVVVQNPNFIADLYIYIITKTLQISFMQNKNSCELDFEDIWKFYRKVTQGKREMPAKEKTRQKWSKWPQWKRDAFFGRMADNLLYEYLKNDYLFWKPVDEMYIGGLKNTDSSFVNKWLEREPPHDEERYDGLRTTKIKTLTTPKQPKQSSTCQAQRTKQRYLSLVKDNGGRDPIIDALTATQG